jgi:hypothetical protein
MDISFLLGRLIVGLLLIGVFVVGVTVLSAWIYLFSATLSGAFEYKFKEDRAKRWALYAVVWVPLVIVVGLIAFGVGEVILGT